MQGPEIPDYFDGVLSFFLLRALNFICLGLRPEWELSDISMAAPDMKQIS